MANKKFIVKRGWLIAKDAFGNMLPFFLHVRDKDIVWAAYHNEFIERLKLVIPVNSIEEEVPAKTLNFRSTIWNISINYTTKKCTLKAEIPFQSYYALNADKDDLSCTLNLPFGITNNNRFYIQATLATENATLGTSTVTACKLIDETSGYIRSISLHVRNPVYKLTTAYTNSSVYLEITGDFGDY